MKKPKWLNETVTGASITSFLSDLSHESVTVLLPALLVALSAPVYALGIIEGISDGISSFVKLLSGYYSDKFGNKKKIAMAGYFLTGIFPAILYTAATWPMVLFGRIIGWFGRGIRGPPRDAILSAAVEKKDLGKAFGFHRMGDTLGAILGPVIAYALLSYFGIKEIILIAVIPGMLAAIVFWLTVKEKEIIKKEQSDKFFASLKKLPQKFKSFLGAVFVFGIADFSHTLLIFFAVKSLTPAFGLAKAAAIGVLLYTIRNITYAIACYPFGHIGDVFGRKRILGIGYLIAVITFIGLIFTPVNLIYYSILFGMAGIFIAAEDTLEGAVAGEIVQDGSKGIGFGALATVNGIGDLLSSIIISVIWALYGFSAGFLFAAVIAGIGTFMLFFQDYKYKAYS